MAGAQDTVEETQQAVLDAASTLGRAVADVNDAVGGLGCKVEGVSQRRRGVNELGISLNEVRAKVDDVTDGVNERRVADGDGSFTPSVTSSTLARTSFKLMPSSLTHAGADVGHLAPELPHRSTPAACTAARASSACAVSSAASRDDSPLWWRHTADRTP